MGNNANKRLTSMKNSIEEVNRSSFEFIHLIGHGGFSKVWKVRWKKNNLIFALKEVSKARVIDKKCIKSVLLEREFLAKMNHPFIVNMYFSFQDSNSLYLVMDLATGKDLRYHLTRKKRFSEEETKFYIACAILVFEYIHKNNVIHRDVKPENFILDEKGYARLTDFGIAKKLTNMTKNDTSGTPGYMAPEVICAQEQNIAVDYYSLGIMAYEFMKGIRPYLFKTNAELKKKLIETQVVINKHELPDGWGIEAADFINRLIVRKPSNRLGYRGASEVKGHIWFRNFQWNKLYMFEMKPPFIPDVPKKDNNIGNVIIDNETMKRYKKIMASKEYKTAFKSFLFYNSYDKNLYKETFTNPHEDLEEKEFENKNMINNKEKSNLTKANKSHLGYKTSLAGSLSNSIPFGFSSNMPYNRKYNLNLNNLKVVNEVVKE